MKSTLIAITFATALLGASTSVHAQMENPAQKIAAQRSAMTKLAFLDGAWRGTASTTLPSGKKHVITQTERVGPFLDGSIKMVEGRGYEPDGRTTFNALGVISFNEKTGTYSMRSNAQGYTGEYVLTLTADGFSWEIPAGPVTMRYTATVKDGVWHEVGDRIMPGKEPVRFLEMNLKRIGDTSWPAAGAVPPQ